MKKSLFIWMLIGGFLMGMWACDEPEDTCEQAGNVSITKTNLTMNDVQIDTLTAYDDNFINYFLYIKFGTAGNIENVCPTQPVHIEVSITARDGDYEFNPEVRDVTWSARSDIFFDFGLIGLNRPDATTWEGHLDAPNVNAFFLDAGSVKIDGVPIVVKVPRSGNYTPTYMLGFLNREFESFNVDVDYTLYR